MGSDEGVTGFHVLFCRNFNQSSRSPAGIPGGYFPMCYRRFTCQSVSGCELVEERDQAEKSVWDTAANLTRLS